MSRDDVHLDAVNKAENNNQDQRNQGEYAIESGNTQIGDLQVSLCFLRNDQAAELLLVHILGVDCNKNTNANHDNGSNGDFVVHEPLHGRAVQDFTCGKDTGGVVGTEVHTADGNAGSGSADLADAHTGQDGVHGGHEQQAQSDLAGDEDLQHGADDINHAQNDIGILNGLQQLGSTQCQHVGCLGVVHQHDVAADHHQADTGALNGADKLGTDHIKNVQNHAASGGITENRLTGDNGGDSQADNAQEKEGQTSVHLFQDHHDSGCTQQYSENDVQEVHSFSSEI